MGFKHALAVSLLLADEFRDLVGFLTRQGTKVATTTTGGGE